MRIFKFASFKFLRNGLVLCACAIATTAMLLPAQPAPAVKLDPSKMAKLGTVNDRYLSYNVEMVEVTGGRFWKPYKSPSGSAAKPDAPVPNQQAAANAGLYQYRPPIDLSNPRLRKLALTLGPAYLRVSGTWQNSTFFQNDDQPELKDPPTGFKGVLTRAQWKGVVDFARATGDQIVTSVAISPGTRDASGVWSPGQAKALFDFTRSRGGNIAAIEFMNEPTFPSQGGAPSGYDAAAFAKDVKVFQDFLRAESPKTVFLGPGGVGEGGSLIPPGMKMNIIASEDILKGTGPVFDAFSYHFYGGVSRRCGGSMSAAQALSAQWLDRTNGTEAFYVALRDKYSPGKPLWLTETAEAACGGDPIAGQFADTFRFLNQLGSLAQKGVQTVMHNTLAASDYGLLDENTYDPRPNYWAALLWNRTMGDTVLDPGAQADPTLRIYAQCARSGKGAVTILGLNTDATREQTISLPVAGERFTLTATDMSSATVLLNGTELNAAPDGSVPSMEGKRVDAGDLTMPPDSVTFVTIPAARNKSCR